MATASNMSNMTNPGSPRVGITCDLIPHNGIERAAAATAYAAAVVKAGGTPLLLPPIPGTEPHALAAIDALLLTGGDDPATEPFGEPTHPEAIVIHQSRQAFETSLIKLSQPQTPILGVCLGMQLMALVAGGTLDQHLPDTLLTHADHTDADHTIEPTPGSPLAAGTVRSKHRQAITDPGSLTVLAHAHDGVIEAIGSPGPAFRLGVQWHPERTKDANLGADVFKLLIDAARRRPTGR
ncbi:MAG: gamma-glutamyl-gamma-aminobutyrate hydrolase family protein [Planctomycetota bacterium]